MLFSRCHISINREIHLGNDSIEYVDKMSNLGVIFQSNLEWDSHVNSQCGKVYSGLRHLRLTANMLPIQVKMKLFKSLLLPHFMYGAEFLLNASARCIRRLRVTLNNCVRWIFNLSRYSSVSHLQQQLLGTNFTNFIKLRSCISIYKIISTSKPAYLRDILVPCRSVRSQNFVLPSYNTSHYGSSFFVRGVVYWNQLPPNIKLQNSLQLFRKESTSWYNRGN